MSGGGDRIKEDREGGKGVGSTGRRKGDADIVGLDDFWG